MELIPIFVMGKANNLLVDYLPLHFFCGYVTFCLLMHVFSATEILHYFWLRKQVNFFQRML
jgi:hypothetical protein